MEAWRFVVLGSGLLVGCARVPDSSVNVTQSPAVEPAASAEAPTTDPPAPAEPATANAEPFEMPPDFEPIEEDEDEAEAESDEEGESASSSSPSAGGPIDPSIFVSPHGLDVPCKSNYDCWLDDDGNIIPTPKAKRGQLLHPCGDGSRIPMCVGGVCEIRYFGC